MRRDPLPPSSSCLFSLDLKWQQQGKSGNKIDLKVSHVTPARLLSSEAEKTSWCTRNAVEFLQDFRTIHMYKA